MAGIGAGLHQGRGVGSAFSLSSTQAAAVHPARPQPLLQLAPSSQRRNTTPPPVPNQRIASRDPAPSTEPPSLTEPGFAIGSDHVWDRSVPAPAPEPGPASTKRLAQSVARGATALLPAPIMPTQINVECRQDARSGLRGSLPDGCGKGCGNGAGSGSRQRAGSGLMGTGVALEVDGPTSSPDHCFLG